MPSQTQANHPAATDKIDAARTGATPEAQRQNADTIATAQTPPTVADRAPKLAPRFRGHPDSETREHRSHHPPLHDEPSRLPREKHGNRPRRHSDRRIDGNAQHDLYHAKHQRLPKHTAMLRINKLRQQRKIK